MKRKPHEKYLDSGLRGWIVSTAKKNYWRVASFYDLDDLIQDGFLAFAICKEKYASKVENKAHFMALFKRVYWSMIIDMANARTKRELAGAAEVAISQVTKDGKEFTVLELLGGGEYSNAELNLTLANAPKEIKALLHAINSGTFPGQRQSKAEGTRETNSEFWGRVLGFPGYDFEGHLRELLA